MKKFIVLTTINKPTEAILKFIKMPDWRIIVVGDLKTPHKDYLQLEQQGKLQYLTPEYQKNTYPELSEALGWNASGRRSLGFIEAYRQGCDLLALADDNIPYDNWGKDIIVNKETDIDLYETKNLVFEPLAVTNVNHLWHRGFPIDMVKDRFHYRPKTTIKAKVLIQANLWNGNPDIDAVQRILLDNWSDVKFTVQNYYTSNAPFNPFDTQNTIMAREVIPHFMLLPNVGRIDDIWGSYLAQKYLYTGTPIVAYGPATVYQRRNEHDLLDDFGKEVYAYKNASTFLRGNANPLLLPIETQICFNLYRDEFHD